MIILINGRWLLIRIYFYTEIFFVLYLSHGYFHSNQFSLLIFIFRKKCIAVLIKSALNVKHFLEVMGRYVVEIWF